MLRQRLENPAFIGDREVDTLGMKLSELSNTIRNRINGGVDLVVPADLVMPPSQV